MCTSTFTQVKKTNKRVLNCITCSVLENVKVHFKIKLNNMLIYEIANTNVVKSYLTESKKHT